jgi:predicted Fe-Mo cluster-binding NifX family protein
VGSKTGEKMKIAIPTADGKLCMHFGHCQQFEILTVDPDTKTIHSCDAMTPPPHEPGVLPAWLHEQGVNLIIAGGMGQRAQQLFAQQDIQVVVGAPAEASEELAKAWMNGTLASGVNACDH